MKKVAVIGTFPKDKRADYLSIPDVEYIFLEPGKETEKELKGVSIVIGQVEPETLRMLVKDPDLMEKRKPVEKAFPSLFKKPIILASASPRRSELLTKADIPFVVMPANVDEDPGTDVPSEAAEKNALIKAEYIAERLMEKKEDSFIILSADTVVSIDGKILGKPKDEEDAFNVLRTLQGRDHEVYTGVTIGVKHPGKDVIYKAFHEKTRVKIYPVSDQQIRDYISTGEPLDKAGSYAIQGSFAKYIKSIKGDYNNVVGLPVGRVFKELKQYL